MAGRDGNRGYLIQTLIALLGSLQLKNWERITIEPNHDSEKVDILWESGTFRKAVQVKSSIGQIRLPDAVRWAKELEASAVADDLSLILVGNCSKELTKIGAIGKVVLPCPKNLDLDGLFNEAAHLLDNFFYVNDLVPLPPPQSQLLVRGLVALLST